MPAFIVSDHETTSLRIREVLLFAGRECPSSHILGFDAAPARLAKEESDLVVLAFPLEVERGLQVLGMVRSAVACQVLAVGPTSDSKLVLRVLRGGADDYVDQGELEPELQAALTRSTKAATEQVEPGRLVTLLAPNGGSGSSTLAVNVATALAQEHKHVGLFDMKLESGDLAALLDLRPTFTVSDLCQNAARLDRVMLERSLVRHDCGVHLLSAPRAFADIAQVTPEGIGQALAMARSVFPYVIVDLDHSFREEQNVVLRQSDVIVLVLRLDFASLRNARRTLDHLKQMEIAPEKIRLVANRFGQAKEVPASMAEEALGMKITHFIPEDAWSINRANNHGVPVVIETPKAKVSRSLTQLARDVNGRHKTH